MTYALTQEKEQPEMAPTTIPSLATKDTILKEFADVFDGLGCLAGTCNIELDKTVRPVQQLPRRIPAPLTEKVKEKITDLKEKGE